MRSRKRNASFARLGGSCCTTQEELLKDGVPAGGLLFRRPTMAACEYNTMTANNKKRTMRRIVVTGGSGKLGRACVQELIEHGYDVFNADIVAPKESRCPFYKIDLENIAQVSELPSAMDFEHSRGVDAIVHLAAIPGPGMVPNETVFRVNTVSTYNVLEAARRFGIRNVVWASSETLLGLPFDEPPPSPVRHRARQYSPRS